ncbi:MAG TPA: mechanosensitive ion channel domain-containing protein [Rhizomicrobium sp.]|jgi:small-conductance mechanosensitive channel|nr:mechanosensitive ion channel domain-containing protein [Rhizomicrobium sp.]
MTFLARLPVLIQTFIPAWLQAVLIFAAIVAIGIGLQGLLVRYANVKAKNWHPFVRNVFQRTRRVVRFAIILLAIALALPLVPLSRQAQQAGHAIFVALFIVLLGWIALAAANVAMDRYVDGLKLDTTDNLLARKAVTQMRILRQAVNLMLGLLTAGFALMSFDTVRQFGISLFASAGVAGIVAGLAARPLFENLIAGLQLAFTQPLRMGDAVVIDNEWGWVEEIGSVYIVVRLWDWRRQVVPLSYLFQNPFTNWTRSSSSIIGTVLIYADYTLPMGPVRAKATEIVKASALWDGQVVNVQVSDAKQQVIEVRVLASASDSSRAWDLRCEVRENLIAYIQEAFPASLPRMRREDFRLAEQSRGDLPAPQRLS